MSQILLAAVLAAAPVEPAPVSLADGLTPLVEHFNGGRGHARVVALVSPTCPACVFGANAVEQAVLEAYPDAEIQVSIVWIDMLPSDGRVAAFRSSSIFDDPRVKQFHDPARRAGWAIAAGLLEKDAGPAWDVYLFYGDDALWEDGPPEPVEWYHQLGGARRAEPSRFRAGKELIAALQEATGRVLRGEAPDAVPDVPLSALVTSVEVLSRPGCPNASTMTANLREACGRLGLDCRIERVNLDALADDDPRRPWGSPTVLVNGADLMGAERPASVGPACRIYPGGGVPGADEIARRLAACGRD